MDPQGLSAIAVPWFEPIIRPLPMPTTVDPVVPIPDVGTDTSSPNDPFNCDPCKGLRNVLLEHEKKLADYMKDPFTYDWYSRGVIWWDVITRNGAHVDQIVQGRITRLKKDLKRQRDNYEKCLRQHGMIG